MKTLLQCRADRLFAAARCPLCGAHKVASFRCDEVERPGDTAGAPALVGSHTFNPDDKAAVAFHCGAEVSIDEDSRVVARIPCSFAMRDTIDEIDSDASFDFEAQEEAA